VSDQQVTTKQMSAGARKRVLVGGLVMFSILTVSPYISFLLGEVMRDHYRYADAIPLYEYSCWRGVVGADPYLPKAICEYYLGDFGKAQADASRSIQDNPKSAVAHTERAFASANMGQSDEEDIEKAKSMDPSINLYYHRKAWKAIEDGADPKISFDLSNKAVWLQPKLGKAYVNRSTANSDLNNFEDAISDANMALELGLPGEVAQGVAYSNRARAELNLGMWEEARTDSATAMKLDPENDGAFFYQALALLGQKDNIELQRFCKLHESDHPWLEKVRKKAEIARLGGLPSPVRELLLEQETEQLERKHRVSTTVDVLWLLFTCGLPTWIITRLMVRPAGQGDPDPSYSPSATRRDRRQTDESEAKKITSEPSGERIDLSAVKEKFKAKS
jgi:tetratricopeptide (TPR) repeat protein